jgi:hypothetical protein
MTRERVRRDDERVRIPPPHTSGYLRRRRRYPCGALDIGAAAGREQAVGEQLIQKRRLPLVEFD